MFTEDENTYMASLDNMVIAHLRIILCSVISPYMWYNTLRDYNGLDPGN